MPPQSSETSPQTEAMPDSDVIGKIIRLQEVGFSFQEIQTPAPGDKQTMEVLI